MDAPEDRLKAVNEHMWSGFASRADIVAVCPHVRFVPILLQKSFFTGDQKFSGLWARLSCKDVGDLIA
jgi:hypothetical protein